MCVCVCVCECVCVCALCVCVCVCAHVCVYTCVLVRQPSYGSFHFFLCLLQAVLCCLQKVVIGLT